MISLYPIQVIALDKTAHQALDLAELTRFDEVIKTEAKHLASKTISDYHQIFVLSELNDIVIEMLIYELSQAEEPIVLLPNTAKVSESLKQLLIMGIRVIFSSSDSLVSVSLSQALQMLESMLYGNETEMEIAVDHQDIYGILKKGTMSEFYESSGSDAVRTIVRTMNVPKRFDDVVSSLVLYEVAEDFPIMEIAKSMDTLVEDILPEECETIFATRNTHVNSDYVKITCMVSRYYDFAGSLQKEIKEADSYLDKVSVIVDAYVSEVITDEEVEHLAARNSLHMKDIKAIYYIAYSQPIETVKLLRMMQDNKIDTQRKVEAIADVVMNESVDADIAEEVAKIKNLSIDEILSVIQTKKEAIEASQKEFEV